MRCGVILLLAVSGVGCDAPESPRALDAAAIARHNQAVAAMGVYDYPAAMAVLEELVQAHPQEDSLRVDLSIAQLNRQRPGDEAAALARLDDVLAGDPANLRAHYTAGILLMNAGDVTGARRHFEVVTETDPGDAHGAYYLGQALAQSEDLDAAVPWFARAIELDPYLRSAYYAGAQAARRTGSVERADAWMDVFGRMEHNPRAHLAEIKYTRMGPKAEVVAIDQPAAGAVTRPEGDIFNVDGLGFRWCDNCPDVTSISVARIDARRWIVLASSPSGVEVLELGPDGPFPSAPASTDVGDPPLITGVTGVHAALWGDVDADGLVDVVLCREGPNELWLGGETPRFTRDDRFDGGSDVVTADGALFDADHDGDLDVFFVNHVGPGVLMNNNGDGTWKPVTDSKSGFPDAGSDGRQVVVADLDGDLDIDILQLNEHPPHDVWINDRLWQWHRGGPEWDALLGAEVAALAPGDMDGDGELELVALDGAHALHVWDRRTDGWQRAPLAPAPIKPELEGQVTAGEVRPRHLAVADLTGDGRPDVVAQTGWLVDGDSIVQVVSSDGTSLQTVAVQGHWTLINDSIGHGPGLLSAGGNGTIVSIPPGPGRFGFVDVVLAGRVDVGQSMRSNASGIGTRLAARVGDRWAITGAVRNTAGPGQNLQPIAIGLGGAREIDFIAIDWSDGVYQTESHLGPGQVHEIAETQRQLSSCPLIFGWNGREMAFMTDCLGVGGLGFLLEPGRYSTPRNRERVLLPDGALAARQGTLELILAEPMQETCYLDAAYLEVIDLPSAWEVLPDERMGTGAPLPTSELLYARRFHVPVRAHDARGADVLARVSVVDGRAVDPGETDGRFLGRVVHPHVLEVEFSEDLDAMDRPVLVLDAWVEYPYSQTMFAAWQAGLAYGPPTIEARGIDGTWTVVHEHVGYPAGMPRTAVLPLHGLGPGTRSLRLTTDLEVYIDRLRVAEVEDCPEAGIVRLSPSWAVLESPGFPQRTTGPQRRPGYDWTTRTPLWDTRTPSGRYTSLGPVGPLLDREDSATVVFGTGDAVRLGYPLVEPPMSGWTRHHVLDVRGWCKDMDLFTQSGGTVEPLPGAPTGSAADLMEGLRTRHRSGN